MIYKYHRCSSSLVINVDSESPYYSSEEGVLFDKDKTELVCYPSNKKGNEYIIPASVKRIGTYAFMYASLMSITIPYGVTSIEWGAFDSCDNLSTVIIPKSVIYIGAAAFRYCENLKSLIIPGGVKSIGSYAFAGCKGLTSVVSEIQNPFEIQENVFSSTTYTKATLTVPKGTKSKYQSTSYWNKFTKIEEKEGSQTTFTKDGITYKTTNNTQNVEVTSVENGNMAVEIPSSVTYNGTTYQVTSISNSALSNQTFNYVSFPSTITSLNSNTLSGSTLGALIWNSNYSLSSNVFTYCAMTTQANFLLYVNSKSYAPSNVKNVIVGSSASEIVLADATNTWFYCPKEFTAQTISYTHNYGMKTGGNGMGWETISLPFNVQKIEHKTKGALTPFASYDQNTSQRPFWLYEMGSNGFRKASTIKANTPYIISMPNNSSYDSEYILAGDVTFSATSAKVATTSSLTSVSTGDKRFSPASSIIDKSTSVYSLNVTNKLVTNTSAYDAGSRFIVNLRKVYPFEAYMTSSTYASPMIMIDFEGETTGIDEIPSNKNMGSVIEIFSIGGQRITRTSPADFDEVWQQLPSGVYIVNGKKQLRSSFNAN